MEGDLLSPTTSIEEVSLLSRTSSTGSSSGDSSGLEIFSELDNISESLGQATKKTPKKRARGKGIIIYKSG